VLGCLTGLAIMPGYRRQVTGMDAAADEAIAAAE
jgi:hypothetical protein